MQLPFVGSAREALCELTGAEDIASLAVFCPEDAHTEVSCLPLQLAPAAVRTRGRQIGADKSRACP